MSNLIRRGINKTVHWFARARAYWIDHISKKPIWYIDQFGVKNQIRPLENIAYILTTRSHYDDPSVIHLIRLWLKPGMIVFDVGANKGDFVLNVLNLIAPHGHIHAFEPVGYTFAYLQENIQAHSDVARNVTLNQVAVYSHDTELTINTFPPEFSGWNSIGTPQMAGKNGVISPTSAERVSAISLDTYCEHHHIEKIDLLKIDVEGFEIEVIEGAAALVRQGKIQAIIFEISLAPLESMGRTAFDVLHGFASYNLNIYLIETRGNATLIQDISTFTCPFFANYLATPIGSSFIATP